MTQGSIVEAYAECRMRGLHIHDEQTPWDWQTQRDLAALLDGRHYRSWLVDRARRDALLAKLKENRT